MDFRPSPRTTELRARIRAFVDDLVLPLEERLVRGRPRTSDWKRWSVDPETDALRQRARAEGLGNLFLLQESGLSNVEYAPLAEEMGRSLLAPEIFNCNAPDAGNMEVLAQFGTPEQKDRWLVPLLDGSIRSTFCMTEPDVASSDATNIRATATLQGDEVVLRGRKWWATGAGHPRCAVALFLGLTHPGAERHQQHSLVLVPMDAPGVTVKRMLSVFGEYDAPYGHGEVWFEDVRLPAASIVGGAGRGFEIAQGRLGPGRIHHCMRCVGAAERAMHLLVRRALARTAFGKPLVDLGGNRERIADLRLAIDQARLLTLYAAWRLDTEGARGARTEISAIKVVAPAVLQQVADEAIQMFGAAGLHDDLPLASLFALARVLRIADGPDAVHRALIAAAELKRHGPPAE